MNVINFVEEQTIDSSGGYVSAGFFYDNANIEGNLGLFSSGYIRTESGDLSTEAFGAIAAGGYTNVEKDLSLTGAKFYMSGGNLADIKGFVNVRNNSVLEAAVTGAKFNVGKKLDVSFESRVCVGQALSDIQQESQPINAEFTVDNDSTFTNSYLFVNNASKVNIKGNATFNDASQISVAGGSELTVGTVGTEGTNLIIYNSPLSRKNVLNKITDGSSITVNGDLNMTGRYMGGAYDENSSAQDYFSNSLYISAEKEDGSIGTGSTMLVKGNVNLTNKSHLYTQTYGQDSTDSESFSPRSNAKFEGNVTVDRNSRFGVYSASDSTVDGDITATNGSSVQVRNSEAFLQVKNVNISDKGSEIGVDRTGEISIAEDLTQSAGASTNIENNSSVEVLGIFSSEGSDVYVAGNSTLDVGNILTLTNSSNLKAENISSVKVGNFSSENSEFAVTDKSSLTVYGNMTLFQDTDSSIWNKVIDGSSLTVNGALNLKGHHYMEGAYDENSNAQDYFSNSLYISAEKEDGSIGTGSTMHVTGDVNLTDHSHLYTQTYGQDSTDSESYSSRSESVFEGNVNVDRNTRFGVYSASNSTVRRDITATDGGSVQVRNSEASLNVFGDVTLSGNITQLGVGGTGSAVIDGNLTQTAGAGTNIENNSSVIVGGDFSSANSEVFVTGNSTLGVGNILTLTDSSNLKAENSSSVGVLGNFSSANSEVFVTGNSTLGIDNILTLTDSSNLKAENSSSVEVGGDFSSENSEVAVTDKSSLAVNGNMTVSDAANAHIGKDSVLTVGKTFSVKDATLNIENGKLLLSGEDAVLDLTSNGVLKTNAEGSVKIEKGAQVKSKTATLVSEDKTTTAEGVAEKTFDADALSKVSLVDFGETTLDEAKKLHSILFTSDTGILDVAIKDKPSADDKGNVSFDDAISAGGTSAVEDKTVANVDTSDKTLSDLTSSDLSWGSASLKEGQDNLNLGSANLVLNNAEKNGGLFVATSDGKAGSVTMDNGANLGLNGSGAIADIRASKPGAGNILIGADKSGSVTVDKIGSEEAAVGSVSVGSGSKLTVSNALYALKATFDKASSLVSQILETPELKAVGDNISIKADRSVLGGLISGKNTSLEFKFLTLKEDLKVLDGASLDTGSLSMSGHSLFVDPAWNEDASVVTADRLSGANGDTLDGALISGQNSLIAVGSSMDINTAKAYAARNLSETGTGAIVYLGKSIKVADSGSIRVDGSLTSLPVTAANTVVIENNGRLVLDNDASVGFEAANGTVVNNGTVAVKKDSLSNGQKIAAFTGENVTVSGTGTYDLGSALFSAQNNGNGTLTVDYDEAKATSALQGTDYTVAQSVKSAVQSGLAVRNGTILGDLVNSGNSASTADTLNQLTRMGALSGSVANAKLASDSTVRAIDSRLKTSGIKTSSQAKVDGSRVSVWVQPVFSRQSSSSLDAGISQYGLKTTLRGGVAGLDAAFADNWTLGAALSVGNGSSSSKNIKNVSGDFDYYGVSLYGAYVNDALRVSSDIGYTKVSNDATAYNSLGKFTADIDTSVLTAGIRGGYTFSTSFADITPHAGIRYTSYDVDDYSAVSGLYRMDNEGGSSSLVSFPVGVSFSKSIAAGNWTVVPAVDLVVIPVAGDKDKDTRSVFDGVSTSVNTKLHDGINYSTYIGLDAMYGDSLSLGISYNYTGSDNVDDHSFNAGVRYTF